VPGARGGALAGRLRCVRILALNAGYAIAARIFSLPPHSQRSTSKTLCWRMTGPDRTGSEGRVRQIGKLPVNAIFGRTASDRRVAERGWPQAREQLGQRSTYRPSGSVERGAVLWSVRPEGATTDRSWLRAVGEAPPIG